MRLSHGIQKYSRTINLELCVAFKSANKFFIMYECGHEPFLTSLFECDQNLIRSLIIRLFRV